MLRLRDSFLIWGCVSLCSVPAQCEKQNRLELDLPTPTFQGTPKNLPLKTLKLDPSFIVEKPPPILTVPEGVKLLSAERPVTGSDQEPFFGEWEFVTDGDKEARSGSLLELSFLTQYVQIDLEQSYQIDLIAVWHDHSDGRVYYDVVVQICDDSDFIADVKTVYNNDHDNSSGLGVGKDFEYIETYKGHIIQPENITGRYVRLYSNGNTSDDLNHYAEVEVYGRPME